MKSFLIPVAAFVFAPAFAGAQAIDSTFVNDIIEFISNTVNTLIPLLIGIAVLLFIYGLVTFVLAADDEEARKAARYKMIWGVIAIFVMVSVWGLVNVLASFFNLNTTSIAPPEVPVVPPIP